MRWPDAAPLKRPGAARRTIRGPWRVVYSRYPMAEDDIARKEAIHREMQFKALYL